MKPKIYGNTCISHRLGNYIIQPHLVWKNLLLCPSYEISCFAPPPFQTANGCPGPSEEWPNQAPGDKRVGGQHADRTRGTGT